MLKMSRLSNFHARVHVHGCTRAKFSCDVFVFVFKKIIKIFSFPPVRQRSPRTPSRLFFFQGRWRRLSFFQELIKGKDYGASFLFLFFSFLCLFCLFFSLTRSLQTWPLVTPVVALSPPPPPRLPPPPLPPPPPPPATVLLATVLPATALPATALLATLATALQATALPVLPVLPVLPARLAPAPALLPVLSPGVPMEGSSLLPRSLPPPLHRARLLLWLQPLSPPLFLPRLLLRLPRLRTPQPELPMGNLSRPPGPLRLRPPPLLCPLLCPPLLMSLS